MYIEKKSNILVVDDDADLRSLVNETLTEKMGCPIQIAEARDGIEGSQKINFQTFDCIITDLNMPQRDGGDFISWIKDSGTNGQTPIIILTGAPRPELDDKFNGLHTIEKPMPPTQLVESVQQQLLLGPLNQRIGARMFNMYIEAAKKFLAQVTDEEPLLTAPSVKSPNDPIIGDIQCLVRLKSKYEACLMNISFDHQFLLNVHKKIIVEGIPQPNKLTASVQNIISRLASQLFFQSTGLQLRIDRPEFFFDKSAFYKNTDLASKGVSVSLNTELGALNLTALL